MNCNAIALTTVVYITVYNERTVQIHYARQLNMPAICYIRRINLWAMHEAIQLIIRILDKLQFIYFANSLNLHDTYTIRIYIPQYYTHIAYRLSSSTIYELINLTRKRKLKLI